MIPTSSGLKAMVLFCLLAIPLNAISADSSEINYPVQGMICLAPQFDPSTYETRVKDMLDLGVGTINSFHGTPENNHLFLEETDSGGVHFIPSIHLICWIRFGDPPYPDSGPLGWENILSWLKLYGYREPNLPKPFDQGPDGGNPLNDIELREQVELVLEKIGDRGIHPSLLAYYAFDEPSSNAPGTMDRIARLHSALSEFENAPLPTGIFLWNDDGQRAVREYMEALDREAPGLKPGFLMYDCYLLRYRVGSGFNDYRYRARQWVEIGREYDLPVVVVPQGFQVNDRPAANELRAQVYIAMAEGCKGISWFRLETLELMEDWALDEIREINADMKIISPLIAELEKVANLAQTSDGFANTFRHRNGTLFVFLASTDVLSPHNASVSLGLSTLNMSVKSVIDCHSGEVIPISDSQGQANFSHKLEPGGGRLFMIETRPQPVGELLLLRMLFIPLLLHSLRFSSS